LQETFIIGILKNCMERCHMFSDCCYWRMFLSCSNAHFSYIDTLLVLLQ